MSSAQNPQTSHANDAGVGWDCHVHLFDASAPPRAGHYRPSHRPLTQIEAEASALQIAHLVLVQPSVYGSDNRLLLQALRAEPGRHRGVVVLGDAVDERSLAALHRDGVRGVRLNCVSPLGEGPDIVQRFHQLAPRIRAHGWHVQWYVAPEQLPAIAALHCGGAPLAMLDHLAGLHPDLPDDHPAWPALKTLAAQGAWIKLSGWYRQRSKAPHDDLLPLIRRIAKLFGDHLVWGSDWPHTWFAAEQAPAYRATWSPVVAALGAAQAFALQQRAPAIYA